MQQAEQALVEVGEVLPRDLAGGGQDGGAGSGEPDRQVDRDGPARRHLARGLAHEVAEQHGVGVRHDDDELATEWTAAEVHDLDEAVAEVDGPDRAERAAT